MPNTTRIALLAATAVLLTVLSACDTTEPPEEPRLRPVRYLLVSGISAARDRSFSGTSKSTRESRLSFKVAGTVTAVPVQIGQRMSEGDLIARLDAASFSLQAQQAQASLVEAQANERNAEANYERTKGLYANDNASRNDLDAARAMAESARAQVRSTTKALEIARLNVSYTELRADTDCSIASINIEVNENVSAGQQVAAVSCGDQFEVEIDVPESLIGRIDEYTPVQIRFAAIPDMLFSGEVTEVAVASIGGAATFPVVVRVVETHLSLRSGLAADVTFQFDTTAAAGSVVLPVAAVIRDPAGTFVYVAEATEVAGQAIVRRRPVVLGELTQFGIEVLDGVERGDHVVTAGLSVIRDGQRVLIP
jgi:RND family efflux transporter MFP subunit